MKFTGFKQARIAKKVTWPSHLPLDEDGKMITPAGSSDKKQAVLLLKGEDNPDPSQYQVLDEFEKGQMIGYYENGIISGNTDTRIFSRDCITNEFLSDRDSLSYGVSYNGLGFDFTDSIEITSSVDTLFREYTIASNPSWLKASQGTITGVANTLNIVVERNRTDDDDRSGEIILVQDGTKATISIRVTQKGRLTAGIPTEYPYVNQEKVIDQDSMNVVQIGEQLWTQENFNMNNFVAHLVNQSQLDKWCQTNGVTYPFKAEDYNRIFKSGYTKVNKNNLKSNIEAHYGNTDYDLYNYQIPTYNDFYEYMGYLVAKAGGTSDQHFYLTTGQTLAKKVLDTAVNGYDDVRVSYPADWRNNINAGTGITDEILKTGTDDYALGYMTLGSVHLDYGTTPLLFKFITEMVREDDKTTSEYNVNSMMYSLYDIPSAYGWFRRQDETTAMHAKPLRLIRYRKLPYEVYYNSEQNKYTTIDNEDTVPEGYSIVPKGTTRGIYLGNPNLTSQQIGILTYWIYNVFMGTPNKKIG